MIRVYQADWERMDQRLRMSVMLGNADAVAMAWDKGLYREVASVKTRSLDVAYSHTNSITGSWYLDGATHADGQQRGVQVEPADWAVEGCRSTSVGDVMLFCNYSVVSSFGFTEIGLGRLGGVDAHRAAAKAGWEQLVTVDWDDLGYPELDKLIPWETLRKAAGMEG
jgi:hypothetical protein